jgi:hypothetical protein
MLYTLLPHSHSHGRQLGTDIQPRRTGEGEGEEYVHRDKSRWG